MSEPRSKPFAATATPNLPSCGRERYNGAIAMAVIAANCLC